MTNQVEYTANGASAVFPFPFPINADTDCQVLIDDVLQSGDYSIRGQGSIDGGAVVFDSAPVAGAVIAIRAVGKSAVSALDASGGYLADKLAAGAGITMGTVTAPGGAQTLVISAIDSVATLTKDENLADLPDKAAARNNLGVYSKAEVEARDQSVADAALLKVDNLAGLADPATARSNLGVYSKTEVEARDQAVTDAALLKVDNLSGLTDTAAARTNLGVYGKTEVETRDQAVTDAALLKAGNLSGLADAAAARTNLEVYSADQTDDAISVAATAVSDAALQKDQNLIDVPNKATARTNLGLDQVAYLNVTQDWTKPQRSQAVQAASVGGSTVLDLAQYQNFNLTLTAAITFANPAITEAMVGQKGAIGITPAGFAITNMGSQWKRVGATGSPDVITGIGRIDYHIRALDRIEYAYNDVEA
ncbi:MAG: hypothetical protein H7Z12_13715 [Rhodospirillaceae bacterium]|nr:hypothetical protein [Rhodospirillales bacterium]